MKYVCVPVKSGWNAGVLQTCPKENPTCHLFRKTMNSKKAVNRMHRLQILFTTTNSFFFLLIAGLPWTASCADTSGHERRLMGNSGSAVPALGGDSRSAVSAVGGDSAARNIHEIIIATSDTSDSDRDGNIMENNISLQVNGEDSKRTDLLEDSVRLSGSDPIVIPLFASNKRDEIPTRVNNRVATSEFFEKLLVQNMKNDVFVMDSVDRPVSSAEQTTVETSLQPSVISTSDPVVNVMSIFSDNQTKSTEKVNKYIGVTEREVDTTKETNIYLPSISIGDRNSVEDMLSTNITRHNPSAKIPTLHLNYEKLITKRSVEEMRPVTATHDSVMESVTETLLPTVTVDPVITSLKMDGFTSRRFQRSIDSDFVQSLDLDGPIMSSHLSVEGRAANQLKKSSRRSDPEPDIDDIIQGIMQLLGGNVKIDAETSANTKLTTFAGGQPVSSTRTNDRGPPRLALNPFNFFNSQPSRTRPPVRMPITSHSLTRPGVGRPTFVANTLPPFYATLPPELDRPRPQIPSQSGTLTAYPIPVNLLPDSETAPPTSFMTSSTLISADVVSSSVSSVDVVSSSVSSADVVSSLVSSTQLVDTVTDESKVPTITTPFVEDEIVLQSDIPTTSSSVQNEHQNEVESDTEKNRIELESSMSSSPPSTTNEIHHSTPILTMIESTTTQPPHSIDNVTESLTVLSPIESHTSTKMLDTSPVATSETINPTYAVSSETIAHTSIPINSVQISTSSIPVISTIAGTSVRPIPPSVSSNDRLRPTPPYQQRPRPGVVLGAGDYRPGQVIGGNGRPGDVFDVTVSAHQGFGGPPQPVRPFHRPQVVPNYGDDQFGDDGKHAC